jgi:hypothetical protein
MLQAKTPSWTRRAAVLCTPVILSFMLDACIGGSNSGASLSNPQPTSNVVAITVDSGPAAAPGQINHAYVTVKVCVAGSSTECASIDHVRLDTGSSGLRLVRSVLMGQKVTLPPQTDASSRTIEECMSFAGGQTWGPVALADVYLAGESAKKVPVQLMDDSALSAPPPPSCGANGTLVNGVDGFGANGVLGVGVLIQDCGDSCATGAATGSSYYGCTAAGSCTAENVALDLQVTNPVALFTADNNGLIVKLPNLTNANGDITVQGELIFGIATQSDNALPATALTVLGADSNGRFLTTYKGTQMPASIDSGTDAYAFSDPGIASCTSGVFIGYYCPAVAPQAESAVNTGVGSNSASDTIDFAIADPNTFVQSASAFIDLAGGGGSTTFTWGLPFFYGRAVYFGLAQRTVGTYSGPFYAY